MRSYSPALKCGVQIIAGAVAKIISAILAMWFSRKFLYILVPRKIKNSTILTPRMTWFPMRILHSVLSSHREFLLRNGVGKTCLWKNYILLYECIQKQGKKNFLNRTLAFRVATQLAPANRPIRLA